MSNHFVPTGDDRELELYAVGGTVKVTTLRVAEAVPAWGR